MDLFGDRKYSSTHNPSPCDKRCHAVGLLDQVLFGFVYSSARNASISMALRSACMFNAPADTSIHVCAHGDAVMFSSMICALNKKPVVSLAGYRLSYQELDCATYLMRGSMSRVIVLQISPQVMQVKCFMHKDMTLKEAQHRQHNVYVTCCRRFATLLLNRQTETAATLICCTHPHTPRTPAASSCRPIV